MTNDELLSKTISYLRFPLTIGVVFMHFCLSKGLAVRGVKYGMDNPDWYFYIINFLSDVLPRIGVPLFFVISGFLFFYKKDFDGNIYKQKLKTRAKTLLIPFILWNVIAIIWHLKCFIPGLSSFYRPVEIQFSLTRILSTLFCNTGNNGIIVTATSSGSALGVYPIDVPLWYVRDLMVMIILTPILFFMINKARQWFIVIIGLLWFTSPIFLPKGNLIGLYFEMFITAAFFFCWGAFYSINKKNFVLCFQKIKYAPVVYIPIAIADVLTKGLEYNIFISKTGILVGVIAAVVVVSHLLEFNKVKVNSTLASSSFFIFSLHYLFIGEIGKFTFTMLHIPDNNPYAMLALYFAVPLFSIAVCFALYLLLRRYVPKLCNLLTGGR